MTCECNHFTRCILNAGSVSNLLLLAWLTALAATGLTAVRFSLAPQQVTSLASNPLVHMIAGSIGACLRHSAQLGIWLCKGVGFLVAFIVGWASGM